MPIASAAQAETYYAKTDGGYYLEESGLQCEWVGRAAAMLELAGPPEFDQFRRLIHGLHPETGEQLTAKLLENRLAGWDVNVNCSKGVTMAIESGDTRIQKALWEATRETVADLERLAATRVRKGKQDADRVTGNLVGYAIEHAETRPAKVDKMPDPHRHIHVVLMNVTFDAKEREWKAVKFRPIMDARKYFDRRFNQRLAGKVAALGYEIETKWTRDAKGGRKYMGWDVKGIPATVINKFSRRTGEIEKLAKDLGVVSTVAKDKLGATSRQNKRKDLTLEDYRRYWMSRMTPAEQRAIEMTIQDAERGGHPRPAPAAREAMAYSIDHHFYQHSVVPVTTLEVTAMERSMGAALPEDIEREGRKQGLLVKGGEATTPEVLADEERIVSFARGGRGSVRPLNAKRERGASEGVKLSAEQEAVCRHIWDAPDHVVMIRGGAGTGKTTATRVAADGIEAAGKRVFAFAQSSDASRRVLRENGFSDAETIQKFLDSSELQEQARGQVLFLDEGSLIGSRTLRKVFDVADELKARVVIFGDERQHRSVERGSTLRVLQEYAGLRVPELAEIRRQEHAAYKQAVAAIMRGELLAGHDMLDKLGWIKATPVFDHNRPLVEDYLEAVKSGKSVIVIAPTHAEGDEITAEIRVRLKEDGRLAKDERQFDTLKPISWTEAERGDQDRYAGTEVVQFHRSSGKHKAGSRMKASELGADGRTLRPEHFNVYLPSQISLAEGDVVRATGGGWSKDRKHRIENGSIYTLAGFTEDGDIMLKNGWVVGKDFGHLDYGLVDTSFKAQGKTAQRVLIAMGHESKPAMNAEQYYVSVSRGKERATIYTGLSSVSLREAIQRSSREKSAMELLGYRKPTRKLRDRARAVVEWARTAYERLRQYGQEAVSEVMHRKELGYGR